MKFTITATIPTAQYANLQPSIEVEAPSFEEAQALALPRIEQIWAKYCEPGKELKPREITGGVNVSLETLESDVTGGKAFFDPTEHIYTNQFGHKLMSGSEFAEKFCPGFNADMIVPKMEAKYGVPGAEIKAMWKAKADASCFLGDAIHKALELYGKHRSTSMLTTPDATDAKATHDNPILHAAVVAFYTKERVAEKALYEVFIVNNDAMLCGHIDRLLITGEKSCRVQDFKTNGDINKAGSPKMLSAPFTDMENTTLNKYWLQLSFYAYILQLAGWTVEGLDIFHYDGKGWSTHTHDVVDITGAECLKQIRQQ